MKKALLVGINRYPDRDDWLEGCINDVKLMYKVTKEKFDFTSHEVIINKEATRSGIIRGLKKLLLGNSPGDILLFHYSGHGSQVPVYDRTTTNESDGLDEILCNYDIDWNEPIRDNDLGDLLGSVKKGVKITVILDCCFSGTGLRNYQAAVDAIVENRGIEGVYLRNRYIPPPLSQMVAADIDLDDDLCFETFRIATMRNAQRKPFIVTDMNPGNAILFSAASDKQYAADADFGGRAHGALTYFMVKVLKEMKWKATNSALVSRIEGYLRKNGFEQTPQLEGSDSRILDTFLE